MKREYNVMRNKTDKQRQHKREREQEATFYSNDDNNNSEITAVVSWYL